jgi:hypothetical protein
VRAGATYYSDEFAVIDGRGRVHPFPKPLSVREPGRERQTDYPAEHFGGVGGSRPLPIGLVAVSRFEPGARWRPRRLSPGQGMLALLEHAVAARREPARAMSALREVVLGAPVLRGARGEAPAAARAMLESLAERAEGAGQAERD